MAATGPRQHDSADPAACTQPWSVLADRLAGHGETVGATHVHVSTYTYMGKMYVDTYILHEFIYHNKLGSMSVNVAVRPQKVAYVKYLYQ